MAANSVFYAIIAVKALVCHHCDMGSNPGVGMWQEPQDDGRPAKVGGFLGVLWFPPPRMTTKCQQNASLCSLKVR